MSDLPVHDVAIIGAGPAGLQCGIYCASEGRSTIIVDKLRRTGGQASTSSHIENFAGYSDSGQVITGRMTQSYRAHGGKLALGLQATGLARIGNNHIIMFGNDTILVARTVVLATGLDAKPMPIDGPCTIIDRNVMYGSVLPRVRSCAGKPVVIVGGANSAGQLAMYASRFASVVHLLIRSTMTSGMSTYLSDRVSASDRVNVVEHAELIGVSGESSLSTVDYCDGGSVKSLDACAVFICVGFHPGSDWLPADIQRDDNGYIVTNGSMPHETSIPGLFAIGDVNAGSAKRVATAVGQGADVVPGIHAYIDALPR